MAERLRPKAVVCKLWNRSEPFQNKSDQASTSETDFVDTQLSTVT